MNWIQALEQHREDLSAHFGQVTQHTINWKPNEDSWSIAENVDHLITVNNSYLKLLTSLGNGKYKKPFLGKIPFIVRLFGRLIVQSVQPANQKKTPTFPLWRPSTSNHSLEIITDFKANQLLLIDWIRTHQNLVDQNPVISSPANAHIVYYLQTALTIIVTHQSRHIQQASQPTAQPQSSRYRNLIGSQK
ncbi:MAG: hypothetical protein ACJAZM_003180 [Cyclobacteriaceae bacterium]|jgi:hypothetical protein